jgi:hypothetical protein
MRGTAVSGLKDQAEALRQGSEVPVERWLDGVRRRQRAQLRLLIFVAAGGLPILAIPSLRHRLQSRVETFRQAVSAGFFVPQPVSMRVGENTEPFPSEFERPFEPLPEWSNIAGLPVATYRAQAGAEAPQSSAAGSGAQSASADQAHGADQGPTFAQGKLEKEAYDLLLQSSPVLAALVQGGDPSLRFQDWAAAKTDDSDSWLVRVTFVHKPDGTDREYIWQVKLLSKEIMPLSAYARALSGPKS